MKNWVKILLFIILVVVPVSFLITRLCSITFYDHDTALLTSLFLNFMVGIVEGMFISLKWLV